MEKDILNIVITGGPCGGKTTALDEITKLLRGYGYTVYLVDEVATELINDGVRPFGDNKLALRDFQSLLLDAQMAKENIRRQAAKLCSNRKVAILYDRGILDNRGYIDDSIFNEFLKERNLSEAEILSRYDIVIHLVTAALGKEEYYTLENNQARTETKEEAIIQDKKTMEAWRTHPNLRIVGNDTLFDEKIEKVKNYLREYIGEAEVIKRERYLIDFMDIDFSKFHHSMIKESIEEFASYYDNDEIEMYSKSTINGSSYYTCITKKKNSPSKMCRMIDEDEYINRKKRIKGDTLKKTRYHFIDDNERFRLDIIDGINSKIILERDVTNSNRKGLPEFAMNAINITSDRNNDDDSIYVDYNIDNIYQKKNI